MTKNSSSSRAEKLALTPGQPGGARKMTQNASKTAHLPPFHHQTLSMTEAEAPPLFSTRERNQPQEVHLRQLHCLLYCLGHLHLSLHNGRQPIQELHQWSLHGLTESTVGTCLRNNWNHQSVDELMHLGLLELALREPRTTNDVNQRRGAQYLYTALGWRCIPLLGAPTGCHWCPR